MFRLSPPPSFGHFSGFRCGFSHSIVHNLTHDFSSNLKCSSAKYEHETVIVENEYPHSAINLVSNANHRIYHGNETDRHSDDYVTPISSPRLQQQQQQQPPATPQKQSNVANNSMTQTTPTNGATLPQPTVPMPAVSPNSTQNQVSAKRHIRFYCFVPGPH